MPGFADVFFFIRESGFLDDSEYAMESLAARTAALSAAAWANRILWLKDRAERDGCPKWHNRRVNLGHILMVTVNSNVAVKGVKTSTVFGPPLTTLILPF